MNSINILLSSQQIEEVSPGVISKLYDLALHSKVEDLLYNLEMSLSGKIQAFAASKPAVRYLSGIDQEDNPKFPNLLIIVLNNNYTIEFEDAAVKNICVSRWGGATGGATNVRGIDGEMTLLQAAAVTQSQLGSAFSGNTNIVKFNEFKYFTRITSINSWSFTGCSKLEEISFPPNLSSMGLGCFLGDSKLTKIYLERPFGSIPYNCFYGCSSLTNFYDQQNNPVDIISSATSLGGGGFNGCSKLELGNITINNSVTEIGEGTFYGCSRLTSVILPGYLTRINSNAFVGCSNLTLIHIPQTVTYIGGGAFSGCSKLALITGMDGVTSTGNWVFVGCPFKTITIPPGMATLSNGVYANTGLEEVTIPSTVTNITYGAFENCRKLFNIKVMATTPATLGTAFSNVPGNIYVPDESVNTYKTSWSQYASKIKPMSEYVEPVTEP